MKSLFIISAHADTTDKQKILIDCIESVKPTGFDIMIVSHTPVPDHIARKVNYVVYDSDNRFNKATGTFYWIQINNMKIITPTDKSHDYPVVKNFRNGLYVAKANQYDFFLRTEYDNIFSTEEVNKITDLKSDMLHQNKELMFFHAESASWDVDGIPIYGVYYESLLMGGFVDTFLQEFDKYFPTSLEKYNERFGNVVHNRPSCIEHYLYEAFKNKKEVTLRVDGFVQNYFPSSQINSSKNTSTAKAMILPATNGKHYIYTTNFNVTKYLFKTYIDDLLVNEYTLWHEDGNINNTFHLHELDKYSDNIRVETYVNDIIVQTSNIDYIESKLGEYTLNGQIVIN